MTTPHRTQPGHRSSGLPPAPEPILALNQACALLGRAWAGLVIAALARGPADFGQVCERVPGISDGTLTDRLQELADLDLITLTVVPGPHRAPATPSPPTATPASSRWPP
ncbi:winged helix-turn-helix transcriptional regulator [Streptomyces sp. NPDC058678]|uniref:winged helix-turn-helix transcriptional regulator n=1 Tax=Streptomyces sp. NPDC058678 TaxID=3346595 RepID=UPI0036583D85